MSEFYPVDENENESDGEQIEIPLIIQGLHVPERTHYESRLRFPPGTSEVTDEAFRQFAEEMREQYEVLESDFNAVKRDNRVLQAELIREKNRRRLTEESHKTLTKKILKVISRDYNQFKFGDVIIDEKFNSVLPCYNENTRRFTNYSNMTRSFLDIFKSSNNSTES